MLTKLEIALVALVAVVLAATGFYFKARHDGAAAERPKTEAAQAEARTGQLETQGARETAQRVELVVTQREAAVQAVTRAATAATAAKDAHEPLDPARADRLRAADGELCKLAPDLCAQPAH